MHTLSLTFLLILSFSVSAQSSLQRDLVESIKLLEKHHINGYQPIKNSNAFFLRVINNLDPDHLLFKKNDVDYLLNNYSDIHLTITTKANDLQKDIATILDKNLIVYNKQMEQVYPWLNSIKKLQDLEAYDAFNDTIFSKNEFEHLERLRHFHSFLLLEEFNQLNYTNETKETSDYIPFITSYLTKLKKIILDEQQFLTQHQANLIQQAIKKAFISFQDPHSSWLDFNEFKQLKNALSLEEKTFGITCKENNVGKLVIDYINPASKVAIEKLCKEGDEIVLLQANKSKIHAPSLLDWYNVNLNEEITSIQLTISNLKGTTTSFSLQRESIENEDNIVRGFFLQGHESVGYISIPSFFTEWESDAHNKTMSNALAKEVVKLKQGGIKGLILDFRNNGGGSLKEAMELISLFIDIGPMFQYQFKNKEGMIAVKTAKDFVRGKLVDFPIIVMINSKSASASELFAAALQSLGNALVVGSYSFGKGTFQNVIPLYDTPQNHDYLTITNGIIYTIDGKTYQGKGVIPDIILPEIRINVAKKESDYKEFIQPNLLKPIAQKQPHFDANFINSINTKGITQRVDTINELIKKVLLEADDNINSLNSIEKEIDKLLVENSIFPLKVLPNQSDLEIMQSDSDLHALISDQTINLAKDPYLQQTYSIINQLIKIWKQN